VSIDGTSIGKRLLELTNQARSSGRQCGNTYYPAARPLVWNSALGQAANSYAHHMHNTNNFRHDPNLGGLCMAEGENIAHGQQSPESVVNNWIRSPNHCANLMKGRFNSFGGAKAGIYWVQRFGSGCH